MNDVLNRKLFKNKPYSKHGTGIIASFQEGGSTDDLFQFDPFMWAKKSPRKTTYPRGVGAPTVLPGIGQEYEVESFVREHKDSARPLEDLPYPGQEVFDEPELASVAGATGYIDHAEKWSNDATENQFLSAKLEELTDLTIDRESGVSFDQAIKEFDQGKSWIGDDGDSVGPFQFKPENFKKEGGFGFGVYPDASYTDILELGPYASSKDLERRQQNPFLGKRIAKNIYAGLLKEYGKTDDLSVAIENPRARALATLAYAYGSGNVANWIREGGSLEDLNIPDEKLKERLISDMMKSSRTKDKTELQSILNGETIDRVPEADKQMIVDTEQKEDQVVITDQEIKDTIKHKKDLGEDQDAEVIEKEVKKNIKAENNKQKIQEKKDNETTQEKAEAIKVALKDHDAFAAIMGVTRKEFDSIYKHFKDFYGVGTTDADLATYYFAGQLLTGKTMEGGLAGALDVLGQATTTSLPLFIEGRKERRAREMAIKDKVATHLMDLNQAKIKELNKTDNALPKVRDVHKIVYDRRGNEIDYTRDYPIFKDAEGNTKQFPEKISTRGEYTALNETVYQNTNPNGLFYTANENWVGKRVYTSVGEGDDPKITIYDYPLAKNDPKFAAEQEKIVLKDMNNVQRVNLAIEIIEASERGDLPSVVTGPVAAFARTIKKKTRNIDQMIEFAKEMKGGVQGLFGTEDREAIKAKLESFDTNNTSEEAITKELSVNYALQGSGLTLDGLKADTYKQATDMISHYTKAANGEIILVGSTSLEDSKKIAEQNLSDLGGILEAYDLVPDAARKRGWTETWEIKKFPGLKKYFDNPALDILDLLETNIAFARARQFQESNRLLKDTINTAIKEMSLTSYVPEATLNRLRTVQHEFAKRHDANIKLLFKDKTAKDRGYLLLEGGLGFNAQLKKPLEFSRKTTDKQEYEPMKDEEFFETLRDKYGLEGKWF